MSYGPVLSDGVAPEYRVQSKSPLVEKLQRSTSKLHAKGPPVGAKDGNEAAYPGLRRRERIRAKGMSGQSRSFFETNW